MEKTETLYERLGGEEGIGRVVDLFYDKVLADDTVNHYFNMKSESNVVKR